MTNRDKLKSLIQDARILRDAQKNLERNDTIENVRYVQRKEEEFDEKLQVLYNEIHWLSKYSKA